MKQALRLLALTALFSSISLGFASASQAHESKKDGAIKQSQQVSYPSAMNVALNCQKYFKVRSAETVRALKDCGKTRKGESLPAAPDCRVDNLSENDLNPIIQRSGGIDDVVTRTYLFPEKVEKFFSHCRNVTDSLRQRREERGALEQTRLQERARSAHGSH